MLGRGTDLARWRVATILPARRGGIRKGSCLRQRGHPQAEAAFGHPQVGDVAGCCCSLLTFGPKCRSVPAWFWLSSAGNSLWSFVHMMPISLARPAHPQGSSVLGIEGREGPELSGSCPLGPLLSVLTPPTQVTGHSVLTPLFLPKEPLPS